MCAEHLGQEAGKWTNEQARNWAEAGFQQNGYKKMEGNFFMQWGSSMCVWEWVCARSVPPPRLRLLDFK